MGQGTHRQIVTIVVALVAISLIGITLGLLYSRLPANNPQESQAGCESVGGDWDAAAGRCLFSEETDMPITLYFYNPALDQGEGGVQCSRKGLVAVERMIPKTTTPLTDAVKLLLRGEISNEERAAGIESEFPLSGVSLVSASITDGVATLTFDDPENKTGGGSCRVGILWAQIEATANQFPTVTSVRFLPEELFQP